KIFPLKIPIILIWTNRKAKISHLSWKPWLYIRSILYSVASSLCLSFIRSSSVSSSLSSPSSKRFSLSGYLSSVLSSAGSRSISPSFSFMSPLLLPLFPLLSPLLSSSIGVSSSTGSLLSLFVVPHADTSVNAKMGAPIFNNHLLFAMFVFPPLLFAIALSLSIFKQVILLFVFFPSLFLYLIRSLNTLRFPQVNREP